MTGNRGSARTAGRRTTKGIAAAAVILCILLFLPVCVLADMDFAYEALYAVSPGITQKLKPVRKTCEDNGIELKFISSAAGEEETDIIISFRDLTGNRLDDTADVFDSYSVNCPFPESNSCRFVEYDADNKEALFLISIRQKDHLNSFGDKITFSANRLLSHKKVFEGELQQIDLSAISQSRPALREDLQLRGYSGLSVGNPDAAALGVMAPMPDLSFSPVQGVEITAAGYVEGLFHIQVHYADILTYDNHGDVYLTNANVQDIRAIYSVSFWDESQKGSYQEYVFDVPAEDLRAYTLAGYFVTCDTLINGNWQITFPLYEQEQDRTEPSQDEDAAVTAKIEESIVGFYEAKDLAEPNDYAAMIDETVAAGLADIVRAAGSSYSEKTNYSVKLIVLEKEKSKDELKLTYQVITTFRYVRKPDVPTTVSNEIQIVYNYNRGLITEFYDPLGFSV